VSAVYLDASAFVKVIVKEPESTAVRRFLSRSDARRISSALLKTEALMAIRHLGPEALGTARAALRQVNLVAVNDRILDRAGELDPSILRTLDAIHLATALAIGPDLDTIVTYDGRMMEGARSLGLPVVAPR